MKRRIFIISILVLILTVFTILSIGLVVRSSSTYLNDSYSQISIDNEYYIKDSVSECIDYSDTLESSSTEVIGIANNNTDTNDTNSDTINSSTIDNTNSAGIITEYYDIPIDQDIQDLIFEMANYYEFPIELIYQIMYTESRFDQYATSETSDYGIMQLNSMFYDHYAYNIHDSYDYIIEDGFDIYNIPDNVLVALRVLDEWRDICNSYGYYEYADYLESYNRGYGFFDDPSYRNYSNIVLSVELDTYQS